MADTIRDVIIRIGIQQRDAKLAAPDLSAWTKTYQDAFDKLQIPKPNFELIESPAITAMDAVLKRTDEVRIAYQALFEDIRAGFQAASTAAVPSQTTRPTVSPSTAVDAVGVVPSHSGGGESNPEATGLRKQLRDLQDYIDALEKARKAESGPDPFLEQLLAQREAIRAEIAELERLYEARKNEERDAAGSSRNGRDEFNARAYSERKASGRYGAITGTAAEIQTAAAAASKAIGKGNVGEAEQQLKKLEEALGRAGKQATVFGTDASKAALTAAQATRDSTLQMIEDRKKQITVNEKAAETFKKVAVSERIGAYKRGQEAERAKEAEEAANKIEAANKKQQASFNIVAESTRAAGEGAFRAARGIVLLTSTADDLQAWLDKLRVVQGGWDVFSGGLSTIQHVAKGLKAMTDAGGIWVVMSTNMARAQAFLTATITATQMAASRLVVLMGGPVVATAVAAIAIWGVATYAMGGFSKQADETGKDFGNLVTQAHLLREALHGLEEIKLNFGLSDELATIRKDLKTFEERYIDLSDRIGEAAKESMKIELLDVPKKLEKLDPNDKKGKEGIEAGLALMKSQEEFQRRMLMLEKEKAQAYREEQDSLQKNLEKQQQMLATTKSQLETERQRVQSIQEQLGRLNEVERLELQHLINKKKAGGTLDEAEVRRYEQLGGQFGKDEASQFFAKKGAAQAEELSKAATGKSLTGDDSVLKQRDSEFKKQSESVKKQQDEVEKRTLEIGQLIATSIERQSAMAVKLYEMVLKPYQMLVQRMEAIERGMNDAAVNRHGAR